MKKRIVSMILALSMVLSILPVSAFADAGTSAAAAETTAAGTNEETTNPVVTIKIGADGLPEEQSGTGWSYDSSNNWLAITGVENAKTEYILSGNKYNWNVAITNSGNEVYLRDGVVKGQLWVGNPDACVLGGSYAEAVLENGTIDGGTYGKLTENGGSVKGGYFKDISGLQSTTQQQAHKLILPEGCTLNGQPVTGDVYMLKRYSDHSLKLEVQYAPGCVKWAAAIGGTSDIRSLPVGISNASLNGYGTISISGDGTTISAEVSMFPPLSESNAPIALTPIPPTDKELSFTGEGVPDVNGVPHVYSLNEDRSKVCVYFGKGWTYTCYPNIASVTGELKLGDQGGNEINFSKLSAVPINCAVELSNATVTGGIIRQADFEDVTIKDSTFDFLSCAGKCTISNVVAQSFSFDRSGDLAISDTVLCKLSGNGIENALADGQRLSKLTVRNGGVTAVNGRDLPSSVNTIYLVGNASAELTLNTDVFSINGAAANSYNEQTYAEGSVLHITSNNDGKEILVNQAGDASNLKPLRITEEGLPDLTEVTPHSLNQDGVTGKVYEGLGWQYLVVEVGYRTMSVLILTSPDGSSPVDLTSDTINPYHKAIASDQIVLTDVTVTDIQAGAPITAQNAIIEGGTFQKAVHADENSSITGGTFQESVEANGTIAKGIFKKSVQAYGKITDGQFDADVTLGYSGTITGGTFQKSVEAYGEITDGQFGAEVTLGYNGTITGGTFQKNVKASGTITDGQFNATVQLDSSNAQILGGVFNNIKLPDYYTSDGTVIQNAVITGSLMADTSSKAAVSNTVSFSPIESQHRANRQQLSKLIVADDGTVESVNGVTKEATELYLVGNVNVDITFSKPVTNINGAEVNAYNGAQLSADGMTLTLTALNDGNPIVVNQTKGEKLPFSSLTEGDFTITGTGVICNKDGVGELRLVYVRTYDDKEFDSIPYGEPDNYGIYKKRVVAEEGDKYTSGSVDIGETVIKYKPALDDFEWDVKTGTVTYRDTSKRYFGEEELPQAELRYYDEPNSYFSSVPTKVGTYEVRLVVNGNNYYNSNQDNDYQYPLVGQYTVLYTPVAENFTYDAAQNTVTYNGDKYNGADPQTTLLYGTDTDRSETVPTAPGSYNVYVQVTADENYNATITEKVGTYVVSNPTPDPDPTPTPTPDPDPTPTPTPDPDPTPTPTPDPNPDPNPTPDPDPDPNPTPDPNPDPNPTPDPNPDPNPTPTPDPDPTPTPTPTPDPTPTPNPDPTPTPTPTPDPEPTPAPTPTPAPAPSDDGGGAIVMVAAVGGAAVGVGAYIAGTAAYLKSVLPEGVAIPANRQQLAVALWTAAGKPATQSTALFNDVAADAAELQAIRWAVDTGLMSAQDGSFKPGSRVSRLEVIRTWKTYQQRG